MKRIWIFSLGVLVGACLLYFCAVSAFVFRRGRTPRQFSDAKLERLPFDGEWFIAAGGDKRSENHHHDVAPQNRALDIYRNSAGTGASYAGDRSRNESYLCWSQPIYSPTSGVVAIAVDGVPDNVPGVLNSHMVSGNCVMIQADAGFVVVLCHFKNGTVTKRAGDRVKSGDLLGQCGNSGNSSEPHLHMHVQSEVGFVKGVALRPVFAQPIVNGIARENYSPRKNDRVANPSAMPSNPPQPATAAGPHGLAADKER